MDCRSILPACCGTADASRSCRQCFLSPDSRLQMISAASSRGRRTFFSHSSEAEDSLPAVPSRARCGPSFQAANLPLRDVSLRHRWPAPSFRTDRFAFCTVYDGFSCAGLSSEGGVGPLHCRLFEGRNSSLERERNFLKFMKCSHERHKIDICVADNPRYEFDRKHVHARTSEHL